MYGDFVVRFAADTSELQDSVTAAQRIVEGLNNSIEEMNTRLNSLSSNPLSKLQSDVDQLNDTVQATTKNLQAMLDVFNSINQSSSGAVSQIGNITQATTNLKDQMKGVSEEADHMTQMLNNSIKGADEAMRRTQQGRGSTMQQMGGAFTGAMGSSFNWELQGNKLKDIITGNQAGFAAYQTVDNLWGYTAGQMQQGRQMSQIKQYKQDLQEFQNQYAGMNDDQKKMLKWLMTDSTDRTQSYDQMMQGQSAGVKGSLQRFSMTHGGADNAFGSAMNVNDIIKSFGGISGLTGQTGIGSIPLVNEITNGISSSINGITKTLTNVLGQGTMNTASNVGNGLLGGARFLGGAAMTVGGSIAGVGLNTALGGITDIFDEIMDTLGGLPGKISDWVDNFTNDLLDAGAALQQTQFQLGMSFGQSNAANAWGVATNMAKGSVLKPTQVGSLMSSMDMSLGQVLDTSQIQNLAQVATNMAPMTPYANSPQMLARYLSMGVQTGSPRITRQIQQWTGIDLSNLAMQRMFGVQGWGDMSTQMQEEKRAQVLTDAQNSAKIGTASTDYLNTINGQLELLAKNKQPLGELFQTFGDYAVPILKTFNEVLTNVNTTVEGLADKLKILTDQWMQSSPLFTWINEVGSAFNEVNTGTSTFQSTQSKIAAVQSNSNLSSDEKAAQIKGLENSSINDTERQKIHDTLVKIITDFDNLSSKVAVSLDYILQGVSMAVTGAATYVEKFIASMLHVSNIGDTITKTGGLVQQFGEYIYAVGWIINQLFTNPQVSAQKMGQDLVGMMKYMFASAAVDILEVIQPIVIEGSKLWTFLFDALKLAVVDFIADATKLIENAGKNIVIDTVTGKGNTGNSIGKGAATAGLGWMATGSPMIGLGMGAADFYLGQQGNNGSTLDTVASYGIPAALAAYMGTKVVGGGSFWKGAGKVGSFAGNSLGGLLGKLGSSGAEDVIVNPAMAGGSGVSITNLGSKIAEKIASSSAVDNTAEKVIEKAASNPSFLSGLAKYGTAGLAVAGVGAAAYGGYKLLTGGSGSSANNAAQETMSINTATIYITNGQVVYGSGSSGMGTSSYTPGTGYTGDNTSTNDNGTAVTTAGLGLGGLGIAVGAQHLSGFAAGNFTKGAAGVVSKASPGIIGELEEKLGVAGARAAIAGAGSSTTDVAGGLLGKVGLGGLGDSIAPLLGKTVGKNTIGALLGGAVGGGVGTLGFDVASQALSGQQINWGHDLAEGGGAAIGGLIGAAVPIPGVDIVTGLAGSAIGGWAGGALYDWATGGGLNNVSPVAQAQAGSPTAADLAFIKQQNANGWANAGNTSTIAPTAATTSNNGGFFGGIENFLNTNTIAGNMTGWNGLKQLGLIGGSSSTQITTPTSMSDAYANSWANPGYQQSAQYYYSTPTTQDQSATGTGTSTSGMSANDVIMQALNNFLTLPSAGTSFGSLMGTADNTYGSSLPMDSYNALLSYFKNMQEQNSGYSLDNILSSTGLNMPDLQKALADFSQTMNAALNGGDNSLATSIDQLKNTINGTKMNTNITVSVKQTFTGNPSQEALVQAGKQVEQAINNVMNQRGIGM